MVNIGDVARHLGVSRSTVSYALSGKRPVSDETKQRVAKAIAELDFVPSARARALAGSRSQTLAALAPMGDSVAPAVALEFINGLAQASRERDYDLLLIVGSEAVHGIDRLLRSDRVDGLVLLDVKESDPRLRRLSSGSRPVVLLGYPGREVDADCVDLDWQHAGELLVSHLGDLGHECVALLGAPTAAYQLHVAYAERFRQGVRRAAESRSISLVEMALDLDLGTSARKLANLLDARTDITGLVVQHESLLPHVIGLLEAVGRRVPQDVSVVGLGLDAFESTTLNPVSGVDNPSALLARMAVDRLVERVESEGDGESTPFDCALVTPVFRDRGSSRRIR